MQITTQFRFIESYGQFRPDDIYHLIAHDKINSRVAIIKINGPRDVDLIMWSRSAFEAAIIDGVIQELAEQSTLPFYIKNMEGCTLPKLNNISKSDDLVRTDSPTYIDKLITTAQFLNPLCTQFNSLISASNPYNSINQAIKQHALSIGRKVNITRTRSQLLIYLAYAQVVLALFPAYANCGGNCKSSILVEGGTAPKRGRPAKRGRHQGYNVDKAMIEKMTTGYLAHRKLAKSLAEIYRQTLVSEFGCRTTKNSSRTLLLFIHPESMPFPSEQEFRYHINRIFGTKAVRTGIYGSSRIRRKESGSAGAYCDGAAFLGEDVEFDAQILPEHPVSFDGQSLTEKLHATECVDVATGMIIGVGAGVGAEDTASHQAMLFCMTIDKVKFCSLFGITIDADEWPTAGEIMGLFGDRGPGMSRAFVAASNVTILGFGASFSGQDKATVETSHDKETHIEGKPPTVYAQLNVVEVYKKELLRILARNISCNVSSRLTPEMIADDVHPTPLGIAQFLIRRGRVAMKTIPFEEAVRKYLTKLSVNVTANGVIYNKLRYLSKSLTASGLLDYAKNHGNFAITAYVLELCVNTFWIEKQDGSLIEVSFTPPLMENSPAVYLTKLDSEMIREHSLNAAPLTIESKHAAEVRRIVELNEIEKVAGKRGKPIKANQKPASAQATADAKIATGAQGAGA